MFNGFGKDYKIRNFFEIENNLICFFFVICMLKLSYWEFLCYFIVIGYMLYVVFVVYC